jgi:rod shape determining protein RodA
MREKSDSVFYNVDWITVCIFMLLITMGWFNIYSAVYDEAKSDIFSLDRFEGKQFVFCCISVVLAFAILIIDASFFTATAYILYGLIILLNIAVAFLGSDVKGSHSWFKFGGFSLQPAEFAKWATLLAIAKIMSEINRPDNMQRFLIVMGIILLPMAIMLGLQNETGVALVFTSLAFILYREGILPGWLILLGLMSAVAFVIGIKYPAVSVTKTGEGLLDFTVAFDYMILGMYMAALVAIGGLRLLFVRRNFIQLLATTIVIVYFTGVYLVSPILINVVPEHQSGRVKCWLGLPVSRAISDRFDYNTRQSMIAIGSGGWTGKGYLQGTQTKFRFVPEQETDFIFCTVGEEWGLLGSATVIILYLILIMRLIIMSERQRSDFTRIYGYGVAAIFFFHLLINAGMTIGLLPVIGIPLPFFSYGGSSLISFTILLFIFIKLDSQRLLVLR